ncbi:MAG: LLM class flavin-dependent oxidoreductase [Acidimicrobiia bacterium]|nr:LLM class flavin-dependent oxidoreductase [Acidimicrobiia bacterium]
MQLGLTLPSFVEDPEIPIAVARAAEVSGVDAVFAFDHLFRDAPNGDRRPSIECSTLLGAVAAETDRIALGSLVARATLRPPASTAAIFDTLARIAGNRLIVGVGAGDEQSRDEMETFALGLGTMSERLAALRSTVEAMQGHGYPVWAGGTPKHVGPIAAELADGWNCWGARADHFAAMASDVVGMRERIRGTASGFTVSWGGLVVLGENEKDAVAKAGRLAVGDHVLVGGPERVAEAILERRDAGATWAIIGPVDSSNPVNAAIVGELLSPLVAG